MSDEQQGVPPCKGCPFRVDNQGQRTDGGYYTKRNLRRLWTGVRRGETMICHVTDSCAHETGSPANPKPGQIKPGGERVCLGALALFKREEDLLAKAGSYEAYRNHPEAAKPPMTREGFLAVAGAVMFSGTPLGPSIDLLMPDMTVDVGVPGVVPPKVKGAMPKPIRFCSLRGRIYTPEQVKPIVKARLKARWKSFLVPDWRERIDAAFADERWLRSRNGMVPGALVRDLDMVVAVGIPHA